jgi:hypothetical protein
MHQICDAFAHSAGEFRFIEEFKVQPNLMSSVSTDIISCPADGSCDGGYFRIKDWNGPMALFVGFRPKVQPNLPLKVQPNLPRNLPRRVLQNILLKRLLKFLLEDLRGLTGRLLQTLNVLLKHLLEDLRRVLQNTYY